MAQVIVHAGIDQRDGHAAGERDDDDRREAHNGDENEQHEEHRHRGHKIVLVKDAELRHVLPVVPEAGGVAVVVVDGFQPAGRRGLGGELVGLARPRGKLGLHIVVIVAHLDCGAGAVDDLVEQCVGESVAVFHVRDVKEHIFLAVEIGQPLGEHGVIRVVQHIAAQQHGVPERLGRGHVHLRAGRHVGQVGHVAAGDIAAAALVVQHVGAGAGLEVDVLAGQRVVRAFGKEGRAIQELRVLGRVGGAEAGLGLDLPHAVRAEHGRLLLRP